MRVQIQDVSNGVMNDFTDPYMMWIDTDGFINIIQERNGEHRSFDLTVDTYRVNFEWKG